MEYEEFAPWTMEEISMPMPMPIPVPEQNRKRERPQSTSPVPNRDRTSNSRPTSRAKQHSLPNASILASRLTNPITRIHTLNTLLKTTASHEINYALGNEPDGELVMDALVQIAFEELGSNPQESSMPIFDPETVWSKPPSKEALVWSEFCSRRLEEPSQTLDVVLVILRNLSFVALNLRLLAHNNQVIYLLCGCLYETHVGLSVEETSSLSLSALHCLVNLAPYLDVTGQRLMCDRYFLDLQSLDERDMFPSKSHTYGIAKQGLGWGGLWLAKRLDFKEDRMDIPKTMVLEVAQSHLVPVWSIFHGLTRVLCDHEAPRQNVIMAMDLLKEFFDQVTELEGKNQLPSMRSILLHIPNSVLSRFVDLLSIPRLGPDALDYVNPIHNIVSRVPTLKLLMSYDATVDTDLRDRSLDVLVPLLDLDLITMAGRLGANKSIWCTIVPAMTTKVGRNEAPTLASQLLKKLCANKANNNGMLFIQSKILELASKDARIAQIAVGHLYPIDRREAKEDQEQQV